MTLAKRYDPQDAEPRLQSYWQEQGSYLFSPTRKGPVFSVDTPPPTVSGNLHLGHVYSYSHPDFFVRFRRMNGDNIFYPMGYDDNGLATERLVEKRLGIQAKQVGRTAFIQKCLEVSEAAEKDYQELWQRLGLSIDWRFTYRTIDEFSRRTSQFSFIELYRKGLAYRRQAPTIWCPECQTAIAQAELNDLERQTEFITLNFSFSVSPLPAKGGQEEATSHASYMPIATTRPELLPACVAVFVHPDDRRYQDQVGRKVRVPLFGQEVPVLADPGADPEKGTGAVMCCTFGDTTDVAWWYSHHLPLIEALDASGHLTAVAGEFAGLPVTEARQKIRRTLAERGLALGQQPQTHSIRVHERCDTPVEYIVTHQWFIRLLDHKQAFLEAGEKITWYPEHMQARYRAWVENLNWDWCISRQRYFGVPFPIWYCRSCGEIILAGEDQLPVDPSVDRPTHPCSCGSTSFMPEEDIFDTWATSSVSPQIIGRWLNDRTDPAGSTKDLEDNLYQQVFPFSLRPQAHEIIRTWAFYTIVKSLYHFGVLPWKDVLISGWGLAGEGMGKISKSRGGGPMAPMQMIERYSADSLRYWAASTGTGKDSMISEERIQMGARLVTKLWNVARFSERFLAGYTPPPASHAPALSPADRWLLARLQRLVRRVTELFERYDYAPAKSEAENFFWSELADNYLEMSKQRLYDENHLLREGARYALYQVLLTLLKLLAPVLPYITEEIYLNLFHMEESGSEGGKTSSGTPTRKASIHLSAWPVPETWLEDEAAEALGEDLVAIATAVRRYKSERNLSLGTELIRLQLATKDTHLANALQAAAADLASITRARQVTVDTQLDPALEAIGAHGNYQIAILSLGQTGQ